MSNAEAKASATSKQKLLKDSMSFFAQDMQKNFLVPIAIMMDLLPASFDSSQLHEAGYLESLRIAENNFDLLEEAFDDLGNVKACWPRIEFPVLGPSCT